MLREQFLGRAPSHFVISPFIKAYIVSESIMWSAWNLITPLFAVFVVANVQGGNIQIAGTSYSAYLVSRVIFELISGRLLMGSSDNKKIILATFGMLCISAAYIGFALSRHVWPIFLFYCLAGIGLGFCMPAKNALFSIHIDKSKAATEWSLADAVQFSSMALATALGGFIASVYGFPVLFVIASLINLLSVIPFLLCFTKKKS